MRNKLSLVFAFLMVSNLSIGQSLRKVSKFGKNPGMLKMYLHIPNNLPDSKDVPLVLVLHGCTQTAKSISVATGWNKLADSLGFIVLYPEQRMMNNVSKCFNFFIGMKAKKDKGETASIKNMITYTMQEYNINTSKIFITGFSAGSAMSNVLLNAYPETFNAGALFGGPPTLPGGINNNSIIVPKILIVQGDKDQINRPLLSEKVLNQWVKKNKMDSVDFKLTKKFMNNNLLRTRSYFNTKKELIIIMLNIKNTGHKILINPGESIKHGGKTGLHTKDIDFHSTYWVADFFGLTE